MADKVPIRGAYNASSGLTGLANFASSETVGVAHGGTGIATVGSNQLVTGNGTSAITSESNLTFDGSTLLVSGTASAVSVMAGDSGASIASQNASKIILVDLTDPDTLWDVQAFLARARYTSWYQELGNPPMRGAIWINNAKRDIVWWNLDTDATYMTFTAAANNVVGAVDTNDLAFLDGKLYFAQSSGTRLGIVDFLQDHIKTYDESQVSLYNGNIEERNDANGFLAYNTDASQRILSATVNGVAAVRDLSLVDEFDRPKHWWSVATNTGTGGASGNTYNPVNDAVYTSTMGDNLDAITMSQSGKMWWMRNTSPDSVYGYNIYSIGANGITAANYLPQANWNGGSIGNSGSAVIADIAAFEAFNGFDGIAVAMDAGLDIGFIKSKTATNQGTESAHIFITSSYQTPYMKGNRICAYPLNDVNDRSGTAKTLTNHNSVTFTSGPFGNTATFNGSDNYLSRTQDSNLNVTGTAGDTFTMSFYFKTTSATNPGATRYMINLNDYATGAKYMHMRLNTNGTLNFISSDGSENDSITTAGDVYDAKWHHVVGAIAFGDRSGPWKGGTHGATGWMRLWVDGVYIGGTSWANTTSFGTNSLYIGNTALACQIAQFSFCKGTNYQGVWTENEINLEYQRMLRGLGGATATLANDDVKSVQIDQNSGLAAITTAANQTEIWDIETGMRESIDATTTATIADADVRLKSGAILPEYITGRSGAIEFDGQERNVLG